MNKLSTALLLMIPAALFAREYDLDRVIEEALASSITLQAQESLIEQSKQGEALVNSSRMPRFTLGGSWAYVSETTEVELALPESMGGTQTISMGLNNTFDTNIQGQYVIFDGFRSRNALSAARIRTQRQTLSREELHENLRSSLVQLGIRYRMTTLNIASLESSLERLNLNRQRIQSFYDLGFSNDLDLMEIDNKRDEVSLALTDLERGRDNILHKLSSLSGLKDLTALTIGPGYHSIEVLPPGEALENILNDTRALRSRDLEISGQTFSEEEARSADYPLITAMAGIHYALPGANMAGDEWQFYYTAGVGISWNLWDGGATKHRAGQITAGREALVKQRAEDLRALKQQTEEYITELEYLEKKHKLAVEIENRKREAYTLVTSFWENGQKPLLDVLDAEQALTEAELQRQQITWSRYAVYQSLTHLLDRRP